MSSQRESLPSARRPLLAEGRFAGGAEGQRHRLMVVLCPECPGFMKSAPKHAAPRAAKHPRGGRHRRRQPFRPSFALKATAAGMFLTVGSLSTMAASAAPTASSATSTASASTDADQPPPPRRPPPPPPRRRPPPSHHVADHRLCGRDHDEPALGNDHHHGAIGRYHSHHDSSSGRTRRRRPHHRRACRRRPQRQYDDDQSSPRWGGLYRHRSGQYRRHQATCTTSGGTGTCSISVPAGFAWDVTETTPPPGYYLNPNLDSGSSSVETTFPYTFRTATLTGTTTVDVPGPANMPNGTFTSQPIPPATAQTFSQQLATSLNDPPGVVHCGLNLALVLDQSGSMAGTKQTNLKAAANEAITDLTGTPSNVAIYTFGSATGPSIAKTSTTTTASAAPLHTFINGLATPAGGTNWDQGLAQVAPGFDEVIFLTDGAPTGSRIRHQQLREQPLHGYRAGDLLGQRDQGRRGEDRGRRHRAERGVGQPEGRLRTYTESGLFQQFELGLRDRPPDAGYRRLQQPAHDHQADPEFQRCAASTPTPTDANGWMFTNTISSGTLASPVTTAAVNGLNGVAPAAVTVDAGTTPTFP